MPLLPIHHHGHALRRFVYRDGNIGQCSAGPTGENHEKASGE
jgi:hypothetical protein